MAIVEPVARQFPMPFSIYEMPSAAWPEDCAPCLSNGKARNPGSQERTIKYIRLGYFDEKKGETMSESEQKAFMDECFAYDDELRKNGHIVGGEALQSARNAVTLRRNGGKVSVTDGPFTETKEQLGGFGG